MVVRCDAGAGLVPLYYRGCDGECFVFLTADTVDTAGASGTLRMTLRSGEGAAA